MRPTKITSIFAAAVILPAAAFFAHTSQAAEDAAAKKPVQEVLASPSGIGGEKILSRAELAEFYTARGDALLWMDGDRPSKKARELIAAINEIDDDGLQPNFYHADSFDAAFDKAEKAKGEVEKEMARAEADVLLSDAFMRLGSNLAFGVIDPFGKKLWEFKPASAPVVVASLSNALGDRGVKQSINDLRPRSEDYAKLREFLKKYKSLAAAPEWPKVPSLPEKKKLEPAVIDPAIAAVRDRLAITDGPLKVPAEGNEFYDGELKSAVIKFQTRHGLEPDGIIGKKTMEAMNVSAADRVCQLKASMDRLRALDRSLAAPKFIIANIPSFNVKVFEEGKSVFEMRAIVGTPKNQTPLLSDEMEFVVFSPKWNVPPSIARKEEFHKMTENPAAFKKRGMRVFDFSGEERVEVDYENVDWSQEGYKHTYRIVQDPGDGNALGKIKFLFPNADDVYMHDTPTKPLFAKDVRAFSHGCVRVSKPFEFAEYLLKGDASWTPEKIRSAADSSKEQFVSLKEKIPVYIVYLTSYSEGSEERFAADIYGRDKELKKYLCKE